MECYRPRDRLSTAGEHAAAAARYMTREERATLQKEDLNDLVNRFERSAYSPVAWLNVLMEEIHASRTSHLPHEAGKFMFLMRERRTEAFPFDIYD